GLQFEAAVFVLGIFDHAGVLEDHRVGRKLGDHVGWRLALAESEIPETAEIGFGGGGCGRDGEHGGRGEKRSAAHQPSSVTPKGAVPIMLPCASLAARRRM